MISQLWSWFRITKPPRNKGKAAGRVPLDRPISSEERAIAEWLLAHSKPSAISFRPQLRGAFVTGQCGCGCPTVDLRVAEGIPAAQPQDNPIGDALGEVNGNTVGVMLLQYGGYLACLEVYDLSDSEIPRPFGLPDIKSLRPFEAGAAPE